MTKEREIADLERAQFGLVSAGQLDDLGLSTSGVHRRVLAERHVRIRRGVLVSPSVATTFEQRVLAAVMSGGRGAFASHESSGWMRELPVPGAFLIEVTTDLKRRPRLTGVKMHRSGLLIPEDVEEVRGIPCSTVDRTIVDLSGRYDSRTLGRIVDDALRRKLTTIAQLEETSARLKSAPGRSRKKMRTILLRRDDGVAERESVLEDFVFEALRRFGLPLPVAQHPVVVEGKKRRIDFCYVGRGRGARAEGVRDARAPHVVRRRSLARERASSCRLLRVGLHVGLYGLADRRSGSSGSEASASDPTKAATHVPGMAGSPRPFGQFLPGVRQELTKRYDRR